MKREKPEEYGKIQYERIKQSLSYKHEFNGQWYRNSLELDVAKILTQNAIEFEYEHLVNCGSRTYFPDFIIGKLVVECTFWKNVDQKAKDLGEKIQNYRKLELETVVVTTEPFIERYSNILTRLNVRVITSDKLSELLDGKFGRVKRAENSFSMLSTDRAPAS